jgi:hypothetical protein
VSIADKLASFLDRNLPDVYPEPRCPWTVVQEWGNRAQCIRDRGHSGNCVIEEAVRYMNGPWRAKQIYYRGINYDYGAGGGK